MSGVVFSDPYCGEPIAWARVGEPVIGHEWTEHGRVAVTERLTPTEAVRKYGRITEVVLGPRGGFESVTYGAKKFVSPFVDPRRTGLYDDSVVVVHDPTRDNYECPVCGAVPGEQCMNKKQQSCATHSKRTQGHSRWDIERAEEAARKASEEAEAAERWQRDMATPPAIGAVLEQGRLDVPDRFTVEQTYANRTVRATAESGEQVFLARNEYNGLWFFICGKPTSASMPCRVFGLASSCRTKHKAGLYLREDKPWELI